MTSTLHEDQYTFLIISHSFLLNPLNAELNPVFHLLALLGAHHILHVSRIRVKMPNIPDKIVEKEGMCCVRYTFSENRAGYEIMWKNNVESDR